MSFSAPTEEELSDTLKLEEYLIDDKDASYLLKVQGDRMMQAGILDGDYVVFERTHEYKFGDIVVLLVGDAYVLHAVDQHFRSSIEPESKLVGVVVSTFRRYRPM